MENIKLILDQGREVLRNESGPEFENFVQVYNSYFSTKYCNTCPGALDSAFDYLESFFNKQVVVPSKIQPDCAFKIKGNGTIYNGKLHKTFTNHNITDEDAFKLLMQSDNYADAFEVKPKDWKEQLEERKQAIVEPIETPADEVKQPSNNFNKQNHKNRNNRK